MLKFTVIATPVKTTIITSSGKGIPGALRELIEYRNLLLTFAVRDYKVRFAQTFLGYWWALLQPLAGLIVLYFVFGRVIQVSTSGIAYFPFALSGLIFWNYFSFLVTQSSGSLLVAQAMIKKIYFPRLCLPFSKILVGLIESLISFLILTIVLIANGEANFTGLLMYIPLILITMLAALGIGLWVSALSIRFRDLQQILPFFLQFLFFLTPVAYGADLLQNYLPLSWEWLLYLNPLTGILDHFRAALFGLEINPFSMISAGVSILLFCSGILYFNRVEKEMADLI